MSRLAAAVLVFALACGHSPAPPPGPRPLTGALQIQRGDAVVDLALRYQVAGGQQLEISAELRSSGTGSVGGVAVELIPDGFALEGPGVWTGDPAAGQSATNTWRLRPSGSGIARVEVRHGLAGAERDTTTAAAFLVSDGAIRLCATADCAGERD